MVVLSGNVLFNRQPGCPFAFLMMKALVKITNEFPPGARDFVTLDDARRLQTFRVKVSSGATEEEHLIINVTDESLDPAAFESIIHGLRAVNPDAQISFYRTELEGRTEVSAGPNEEFSPFSIAAAVAVVKASCGWDESEFMVIKVHDVEINLSLRFDGQRWVVTGQKNN
jgi:hypothetical protein